MTADSRRRQIPPGTVLEYRLARLRFSQGYFVRRSIDVWPTDLEGNKLAELDCLAIAFDPQLNRSLEVVECKTSASGQGEIDRLIWLKGMGSFTQARAVTFAKLRVAPRTRDFAQQLRVQVLDESGVSAAENELNIDTSWWPGFHDPQFGEQVVKTARAALTSSPELRRLGKYLYGSFWFADDFTRVKQLQTLFRLLVQHRGTLSPPALLLGIGEATTLFTLTTLSIAAWRNQLTEEEFRRFSEAELSTGLGDPRSLRTLLRRIDSFQREQIESLHSTYQEAGVGRLVVPVRNLETEILTSPEWIDAFVNVVSRFARRAHLATDVMRWTDLWASDLLGAPKGLTTGGRECLHNLNSDEKQLQAALDLVQAFLVRHWGVPAEMFEPPPFAAQKKLSDANSDDGSSASQDTVKASNLPLPPQDVDSERSNGSMEASQADQRKTEPVDASESDSA